jgi:hypothetical protein
MFMQGSKGHEREALPDRHFLALASRKDRRGGPDKESVAHAMEKWWALQGRKVEVVEKKIWQLGEKF